MRKMIVTTALFVVPLVASAQQAVVVLRDTITGNREQPKVLYIVPWQQAASPDHLYQPLQSLAEEVFAPIDRDEFLRETAYRRLINFRAEHLSP